MITLRDYQAQAVDAIFNYFQTKKGVPLLVLPTGAGKSIIIAEFVRRLWCQYGSLQPKTLIIVPSCDLALQNAEKLRLLLPNNQKVGLCSASLGKKELHHNITVATIGSICNQTHKLEGIKAVLIDEAHLINSDGLGDYRKLIKNLAKHNKFMLVGMTATPFRGAGGVWLTQGKNPLFTSICYEVKLKFLIDRGYLSKLVISNESLNQIDTTGIKINNGDYAVNELTKTVNNYLPNVAKQAVQLAQERKKWLAFTPSVENANTLAHLLQAQGIKTGVVTGSTKKEERFQLIEDFRNGDLHCLVTVLALAVGFDAPAVDCIIWTRPTKSKNLYVQGAGRGLRIAPNKDNCLWLDFTNTTSELGPLDEVKGTDYKPPKKGVAPFKVCNECFHMVRPANAKECPECGALMPVPPPPPLKLSKAQILADENKTQIMAVQNVTYTEHKKEGSPPCLRVVYHVGGASVSEWIFLESDKHWARKNASTWWNQRGCVPVPNTVASALAILHKDPQVLRTPRLIHTRIKNGFQKIIKYDFNKELTK